MVLTWLEKVRSVKFHTHTHTHAHTHQRTIKELCVLYRKISFTLRLSTPQKNMKQHEYMKMRQHWKKTQYIWGKTGINFFFNFLELFTKDRSLLIPQGSL